MDVTKPQNLRQGRGKHYMNWNSYTKITNIRLAKRYNNNYKTAMENVSFRTMDQYMETSNRRELQNSSRNRMMLWGSLPTVSPSLLPPSPL